MAVPVNPNRNKLRVLNNDFENSEYGMLARLFATFVGTHTTKEKLEKQIRMAKLMKYKDLSDESKRKLATLGTLVKSSRLSFKNFLYLFKELLRGNRLQINFILKTLNDKEYLVSHDIILQAIKHKDAHKILFKIWDQMIEKNKLKPNMQYLLRVAREKDKEGMSPERINNINGMGKHLHAGMMTFKVFVFLCTELLNGESLQMNIVYMDAYNKKFTSGIKIILKEASQIPKGDENELSFGE